MKRLKLHLESDDSKIKEDVDLTFSDEDIEKIKLFSKNMERFTSSKLIQKGFPTISNINAEKDKAPIFNFTPFEYSDIYEFLHLARPIFLSKEPASFEKTMAVFGRKSKDNNLKKHLKYLRTLYNEGEYKHFFQIFVNEQPIFDSANINNWLNGVEYHQDLDKKEEIEKLEKSLSEEVARGIFISQLSGRVKAAKMLNDLVQLTLE